MEKSVLSILVKDLFFLFSFHLSLGKKCSNFDEDFFFCWSSPECGEKSVLFLMKTFFFWSSPEFGEKSVPFAFFLVFSKFPHMNKIVVEVHLPPMLKIGQNWGKIGNYPPPMLKKDRHHWFGEKIKQRQTNVEETGLWETIIRVEAQNKADVVAKFIPQSNTHANGNT